MPLYSPTDLKQFLKTIDANPKKALSQNFLIDGNIVEKILNAADIKENDQVLEIGPGPGVLTEALLDKKAVVAAVEKDHLFATALHRLSSPHNSLTVFEEDFLTFSLNRLKSKSKIKVVANLPYSLSTPILMKLLADLPRFSVITLMIQKEMAQRLLSCPGSKSYGLMNVLLQTYTSLTCNFFVSRNSFYPSPKVDSAVISLTPKKFITPDPLFFKMVQAVFLYRRKMLVSTLKPLYSPEKIQNAFESLGISSKIRPEQMSADQFLKLFENLES